MGSFVTPIIVGRSEELRQHDNTLAAVQGDAGYCVLQREEGIGKSRLLAEIRETERPKGVSRR